jgi:hypothetical protein
MSSGGEQTPPNPDPYEVLQQQFPIKYTLPFSWGQLKITQDAYENYGLTPLAPGFIKGDAPLDNGQLSNVIVRIIGPSELPEQSEQEERMGFVIEDTIGSNIRLDIGYSNTKEEQVQQLRSIVEARAEEEFLTEQETEELQEEYERDTSQEIVHSIVEAVEEGIVTSYVALVQRERTKNFVLHAAGFLGVIASAAAVEAYGMRAVSSSVAKAGAAGGIAATLGVGTHGIKSIIESFGDAKKINAITNDGRKIAEVAASNIHDAFCTDHFDAQAQELLGEDAEQDPEE